MIVNFRFSIANYASNINDITYKELKKRTKEIFFTN